jgi:hypothetical protein
MTGNGPRSGALNKASRRLLYGWSLALAFTLALPVELPAARFEPEDKLPSSIVFLLEPSPEAELILAHCCHAHPLPPYDSYCCHSGAVVVTPGYGYYGVTGVRGTSRRVARRTTRRVSRRR